MRSKHYPFFKPTTICKRCGEPIAYQPNECLYIHDWGRRGDKNDNGYWCLPRNYNTSAEPIDDQLYKLKPGDEVKARGCTEFEIIKDIIYDNPHDGRNEDDGLTRVTINGLHWYIDDIMEYKKQEVKNYSKYESIQEDNKE